MVQIGRQAADDVRVSVPNAGPEGTSASAAPAPTAHGRQRFHDAIVGALRAGKRRLDDAGFDAVFHSKPAYWLRIAVFTMRASDVAAAVAAVEAAGVPCWVAGGWGIDALLGRQTRGHNDLDLCIEVAQEGEVRAGVALTSIGYRMTAERADSGDPFPLRAVYRDGPGRTVDLLLVTAEAGSLAASEGVPVVSPGSLSIGRIDGRVVGCLSAAEQIHNHERYLPHPYDVRDVEALCSVYDVEPPAFYRNLRPAQPPRLRERIRRIARAGVQFVAPRRATTALVVPVPAAGPVFTDCMRDNPGGLPAHIAVVSTFLPSRRVDRHVLAELADVVGAVPALAFRLAGTQGCPDGVYLEADPPEPFVQLTAAVARRWPLLTTGSEEDAVPQLRIPCGLSPSDLTYIVDRQLPIEATADEIVVMARDRWGSWAPRTRIALGRGRDALT